MGIPEPQATHLDSVWAVNQCKSMEINVNHANFGWPVDSLDLYPYWVFLGACLESSGWLLLHCPSIPGIGAIRVQI
jgi:hypothetical protein